MLVCLGPLVAVSVLTQLPKSLWMGFLKEYPLVQLGAATLVVAAAAIDHPYTGAVLLGIFAGLCFAILWHVLLSYDKRS